MLHINGRFTRNARPFWSTWFYSWFLFRSIFSVFNVVVCVARFFFFSFPGFLSVPLIFYCWIIPVVFLSIFQHVTIQEKYFVYKTLDTKVIHFMSIFFKGRKKSNRQSRKEQSKGKGNIRNKKYTDKQELYNNQTNIER